MLCTSVVAASFGALVPDDGPAEACGGPRASLPSSLLLLLLLSPPLLVVTRAAMLPPLLLLPLLLLLLSPLCAVRVVDLKAVYTLAA